MAVIGKRAQITLFIILGIVLVFMTGILLYYIGSEGENGTALQKTRTESLSAVKNALSVSVQSCLESESSRAINKWGWLRLEKVKEDIERNIDACINWDAYEGKGVLFARSMPAVSIEDAQETLIIGLSYGIKLSTAGATAEIGEFGHRISKVSSVSLEFGASGKTARDFVLVAPEGLAELQVKKGTSVKDSKGGNVNAISVKIVPVPDKSSSYSASPSSWEFGPSGTVFSPPAEFSFIPSSALTGSLAEGQKIRLESEGSFILLPFKKIEQGRIFFDLPHFSIVNPVNIGQTRFCSVSERLSLLNYLKHLDPAEREYLGCVSKMGGKSLFLDELEAKKEDFSACGNFDDVIAFSDKRNCLLSDALCEQEQAAAVSYSCEQESKGCSLYATYKCDNPSNAPLDITQPKPGRYAVVGGPLRLRTSPELSPGEANVFPYLKAENRWVLDIGKVVRDEARSSILWGKIDKAVDEGSMEVSDAVNKWVAVYYEGEPTVELAGSSASKEVQGKASQSSIKGSPSSGAGYAPGKYLLNNPPYRVRSSPELLYDAEDSPAANVVARSQFLDKPEVDISEIFKEDYQDTFNVWGRLYFKSGERYAGFSGSWVVLNYLGQEAAAEKISSSEGKAPDAKIPEKGSAGTAGIYTLTATDTPYRIRTSPRLLSDAENVIANYDFSGNPEVELIEIAYEQYGQYVNMWGRLPDNYPVGAGIKSQGGEKWIAIELNGISYAKMKDGGEGKAVQSKDVQKKGGFLPPPSTYFPEKFERKLLHADYEGCRPACKKTPGGGKADMVIVSTKALFGAQFDSEDAKLLRAIEKYMEVVEEEGVSSEFIILDADGSYFENAGAGYSFVAGEAYGIDTSADFMQWQGVKKAIDRIHSKRNFKYILVLGDDDIIPMPRISEPTPQVAVNGVLTIAYFDNRLKEGEMFSTQPYEDMNNDGLPDVALARLYDQRGDSSHATLIAAFSRFAGDRSPLIINDNTGVLYSKCEGNQKSGVALAFNDQEDRIAFSAYDSLSQRCYDTNAFLEFVSKKVNRGKTWIPVPENCESGPGCKGSAAGRFSEVDNLVTYQHGNSNTGGWLGHSSVLLPCSECRDFDCIKICDKCKDCYFDMTSWQLAVPMSEDFDAPKNAVFTSACFSAMTGGNMENYAAARFMKGGSRAFLGFYGFAPAPIPLTMVDAILAGNVDGKKIPDGTRLGDAILNAKRKFYNSASTPAHFTRSFQFIGDPTIKIAYV